MELAPDGWYCELSLEFQDGSVEMLQIRRKPTGTHIPLLRERPADWTLLSFHKCPCCPYPSSSMPCPAALSLQTTMSKLRTRKSYEKVKATAVDARGRSKTVEWPLQNVGSALVQLAVFESGCPVGHRLKPFLQGLPPFAASLEVSRRIAEAILRKHGGSVEAARQELAETLAPLRDVFACLTRRIRKDEPEEAAGEPEAEGPRDSDALPNSIAQMDAFSQLLAMRSDKLFSQVTAELGWQANPAESAAGGIWSRLLGLFRPKGPARP